MSKRVFIALHTGCTNNGCEGLLTGARMLIYNVLGKDTKIIAASESPEYDSAVFPDIEFLPFAYFKPSNLTKEDLLEIGVPMTLEGVGTEATGIEEDVSLQDKTKEIIKSCDYMVGIGGDMFSDDYGYNQLFLSNSYVEIAKQYGVKVILFGHSIGRFRSERTKREAFAALEQCDLITVREPHTYQYLKEEGFPMDKVFEVADLAFLMKIEESDDSDMNRYLTQEGLNIGIGMSDGIAKYCGGDESVYIDEMKQLTLDLLERYPNSKVFYIPHVYNSPAMDDRKACKKVEEAVNSERAFDIGKLDFDKRSAKNVKAFLSKLDAFIGSRTHSTIASWSTLVPTIAIAYSIKAHGIAESFFGDNYQEYLEDYRDHSYERMRDKLFDIIDRRAEIKEHLRQQLPMVEKKVALNEKLFRDLVQNS